MTLNHSLRIAAILTFTALAAAGTAAAPEPAAKMNGIAFSDYPEFHKKWKQVTVRYRKDTDEMRFVYANDIAMKALEAGKSEYPDGSVIAKIGTALEEDATFPSSAVPTRVNRVQFMVKNKRKYPETDGWGYALFDANGALLSPEPIPAQTTACHSCHRLVPQRDFVFAQPVEYAFGTRFASKKSEKDAFDVLKFEKVAVKNLPESVRSMVPPTFTTIHSLQGPMRKYLFEGTLLEVPPLLGKKARREKAPAVLMSENGMRFTIVYPIPDSECKEGSRKGVRMMRVLVTGPTNMATLTDIQRPFCQVD